MSSAFPCVVVIVGMVGVSPPGWNIIRGIAVMPIEFRKKAMGVMRQAA
ncbi:hypothetical protein [Candidatus Litorirhabdus singularis]|nr:hypothetical protein [Candidatus Litorirhabdus singularis]